jgi:hypothetical protein
MNARSPDAESPLIFGNYAVGFIDLLGQRAALRGQQLLPRAETDEDKQKLVATLKASVGSIAALQQYALDLARGSEPDADSPRRAQLPREQQALWDEMHRTRVVTQRWSDGLMMFANLGDDQIKCQLNNVDRLFTFTGALCFIGLASRKPLRGAIEIAWGVELHPGELYGAAVARAYELESEVAGYPRILVGPQMMRFLDSQAQNPNASLYDQFNKKLATACRNMLAQDADGHFIVHYLGDVFVNRVTQSSHQELYEKALTFVVEQIKEHQASQNTKLPFRYVHLHRYFTAHPPPARSG